MKPLITYRNGYPTAATVKRALADFVETNNVKRGRIKIEYQQEIGEIYFSARNASGVKSGFWEYLTIDLKLKGKEMVNFPEFFVFEKQEL